VVVTFALLAVSCAGAARAQDKPPAPDASSVAQYVELIPTASGSTAPGVRGERRFPLPPAAKRALAKTSPSTAKALAIVATSSTYGALPTPPGARPARVALPAVDGSSRDRSLRAMATAVAPTGEIRMIGLLLILVAVTAGGAALSVRRGRF
jgi:hypothetical protein